jgi:hypothetical protein
MIETAGQLRELDLQPDQPGPAGIKSALLLPLHRKPKPKFVVVGLTDNCSSEAYPGLLLVFN